MTTLFPPTVVEDVASGFDTTGQSGLAHEAVSPDVVEQLLLRHRTVAVLDQVPKHVEDLRLDVARLSPPAQFEALRVELELLELEDHPSMMARRFPRRLVTSARPFALAALPIPCCRDGGVAGVESGATAGVVELRVHRTRLSPVFRMTAELGSLRSRVFAW